MTTEQSLIDSGLTQGALICCDTDGIDDLKQKVMKNRAIPEHRGKPVQNKDYILVLSQDCDIASSREKYVEVLAVKVKTKLSPSVSNNINYGKLQLVFENEVLELEANKISQIEKSCIDPTNISIKGRLAEREIAIFHDWRSGRYRREPFPHAFNIDFLFNYIKKEENGFDQFLKDNADTIIDLFVYVDPKDDEDAKEYRVVVTALVIEECDDEKYEDIKQTIEEHLKILHERDNKLIMAQIDQNVELDGDVNLEIVSRLSEYSFLDAAYQRRFNLDYMCYEEPEN